MVIIKRNLCKGEKCRKWKHLNEEGFCEKCSTIIKDDNDDELCGMCPKTGLDPSKDDEAAQASDLDMKIQCDLCDEWFHAGCAGTKDFIDYISQEEPTGSDQSKGSLAVHLWFCSICVSHKKEFLKNLKCSLKSTLSPKDKKDDPDTKLKAKNCIEPCISDTDPVSEKKSFKVLDKNTSICKYYKKGVCRHGSSGKTLWNNRSCNFLHPKKCLRFCKHGDKPGIGCTNKECPFLHPVLCYNSTSYGECYNSNCTYQHLGGTQRFSNFSKNSQTRNSANLWVPRKRNGNFNNTQKNGVFHRGTLENTSNLQYDASFQPRQPDFHFDRSDFPPIPRDQQAKDAFSMDELPSVLKNIQQEIHDLKINQKHFFTQNTVLNQETEARPVYQGQEGAPFHFSNGAKNFQN